MKKSFIGIVFIFVIMFGFLFFIPSKDIGPEIVSGDGHIYKGQRLNHNWFIKFTSLSRRSSWLNSTQYINAEMKSDIEDMIYQAEQDGYCLVVTSAYRNPEKQQLLYDSADDKNLVALPMESEHQTGLAVDFAACPMNEDGVRDDSVERPELVNSFNEQREYSWLLLHAKAYGFEESFTSNNIDVTGFPAEPWHWKYIIKE